MFQYEFEYVNARLKQLKFIRNGTVPDGFFSSQSLDGGYFCMQNKIFNKLIKTIEKDYSFLDAGLQNCVGIVFQKDKNPPLPYS